MECINCGSFLDYGEMRHQAVSLMEEDYDDYIGALRSRGSCPQCGCHNQTERVLDSDVELDGLDFHFD